MTGSEHLDLSAHSPMSVAILAGGQSSRMGTNKAVLRLQPTGPMLIERVMLATQALTDDLFVVSREAGDYPGLSLPIRGDRYPETGVLGAICTALEYAQHARVLVVSCDMPFLCTPSLQWMATLDDAVDAIVPVVSGRTRQGGDVTHQTLHAIYGKQCIPAIQAALTSGNRRVISFFDQIVIRQVTGAEIAAFDTELLTFMSVNTPEALENAVSIETMKLSRTESD